MEKTTEVGQSAFSGLLCGDDFSKCKYYEFYNSVSCIFVEGVEFMTRDEIYAAIKRDWEKVTT